MQPEFIQIDYQKAEYFRYFFESALQIKYIICFDKRLCFDLILQFDKKNYRIASRDLDLDEALSEEAVNLKQQEDTGEWEAWYSWKASAYQEKTYRLSTKAYQQLTEHLEWIANKEERQALEKLFRKVFGN